MQYIAFLMASKVDAIAWHNSALSCFQRAEALSENKAAMMGGTDFQKLTHA